MNKKAFMLAAIALLVIATHVPTAFALGVGASPDRIN